jgi:polyphenol oxidase
MMKRLELERSPLLTAFAHGFSTAPADFALLREERKGAEAELATQLGIAEGSLKQVTQVHSTRFIVLTKPEDTRAHDEQAHADALIARAGSGAVVAVRVADCVPLLIADERSGDVAAIHAGWRGLAFGIIEDTIRALASQTLVAAIGPCIGTCCFEVGEEVAQAFCKAGHPDAVRAESGTKPHVDLRKAARHALRTAGLLDANIGDVGGCSRCESRYHSYRRDGDKSGRMIAAIAAT